MKQSLACVLEQAARRWPERVAIEDGESTVSFAVLRETARRAAAALLEFGADRMHPVAVFLPKGRQSVLCFHAAVYCGVPYSPLDYDSPALRIVQVLNNLQPSLVITDEKGLEKLSALQETIPQTVLAEELFAHAPDEARVDAAIERTVDTDPAAIMYTSGSTGVPKGVLVTHRGIMDYTAWVAETFGVNENTVIGEQSGFSFDNSILDLYTSVLTGARMILVPEALYSFHPRVLLEYLAEKEIELIFWVPTLMIRVANSGALETTPLPALKTVLFAGEVMPNKQLNVWRKALPHVTYANLYGPTEITVDCTAYIVDRPFADEDPLPIGYACANSRILILRPDGSEAEAFEQGELCVAGTGVALGYWRAPELTAKVFTPNPANGRWNETIYHTGDVAYRDREGLIFFCGRRDSQVQIGGNRVELGDIETAAREVEGVQNACCLYDAASERIVLFAETTEDYNLRRFKSALSKLLPHYMLPGKLVCMEKLPLNINKKIDRALLRKLLEQEGSA